MDLNRRPPPYKGGALTAELYAHKNKKQWVYPDSNGRPLRCQRSALTN